MFQAKDARQSTEQTRQSRFDSKAEQRKEVSCQIMDLLANKIKNVLL